MVNLIWHELLFCKIKIILAAMWLLYDLNKIVKKKINKSINNNNFIGSELISSVEFTSLQLVTFLIHLNTKKGY